MLKKPWIIRIVVIGVIFVALGYVFGDQVLTALRSPQDEAHLTTGERLTVSTVQTGSISRFVTASGNLKPRREVNMQFDVSARVEHVYVAVGDRVTKGSELVSLDNRQQELAYLQAMTNHEIALIDSPPNVIKEREYDMEIARDALERTILRAPFDGLITEIDVEPGETVATSKVVVSMIDDSIYKVDISIDELDIGQLEIGQNATISLDADRGRPRQGIVESIGWVATIQGNMVTVPVTVRLNEVDPILRPGYTSTVQIAVIEANDVIRIPIEAINNESGQNIVTKVIDGEPVSVPVQTGITDGVWVEIVSGLEAGDQIVGLNYRGVSSGRSGTGASGRSTPGFPGGGVSTFGGTMIRR